MNWRSSSRLSWWRRRSGFAPHDGAAQAVSPLRITRIGASCWIRARRLDAVNVSTPDHMHAIIAMSAMELGKHAYIQKPLAHDIFEVRKTANSPRKSRW